MQDEVDDGRTLPISELGGVATDGGADDGEDAGTNDDANAECGERERAERFVQGVLGQLGGGDELVDGFSGEDLAGLAGRRQGAVLVRQDLEQFP